MAEELGQFADILEKAEDFNAALQALLHDTFKAHQRIIFNGNGYDDSWAEEAKRRGLSNLRDTVDSMPAYIDKKNIDLFTKHDVFSQVEMHARYGIHLENYCKITAIEANTLLAMIRRSIFPAVSRYTGELAKAVQRKKALYLDCAAETDLLQTLCTWNEELYNTAKAMTKALAEAPDAEGGIESARYYRDVVYALEYKASHLVNRLESHTAAEFWPYPTYADILFSV